MTFATHEPTRSTLRVVPLEDRVTPVSVRFDYTFDTTGYFTADRRAALERAAAAVTARMPDTLQAIVPAAGNSWTARAYNAATGQTVSVTNPVVAANEVVVYVSAGSLGGALALASGGAYTAAGSPAWLDTIRHRGQTGVDAAHDYATWGGMIAFNAATRFDFTAGRPAAGQYDFDAVAMHELMHVFGFGLENPSFTRLVSGGAFTGPAAVQVFGRPVPMQPGAGSDHFAQGTRYGGQESVVSPAIAPGVAKRMTELEYAALRDIGWGSGPQHPPAVPPAPPPPPPAAVSPVVNAAVPGGLTRLAIGTRAGVTAVGPGGQPLYAGTTVAAGFTGGERVATADVTGDGVADYVVGAGPGGAPRVTVVNGQTGAVVHSFLAFEPHFPGGVYVAAGDMTGDGRADVVVGAGEGGGPRVKVYDGATGAALNDLWGIADPAFRGGVRVAVGDVTGDGRADLVAAAGEGGGPRVAAYDSRLATAAFTPPVRLFADFFAYPLTLSNGTYVAVADVDGDGLGDVVTGAGEGGGPHVKVFGGRALLRGSPAALVASFFAGDPTARSGVRVAAADLTGDGRDDLVTAPGATADGTVRVYAAAGVRNRNPDPTPYLQLSKPEWVADGVYVG